MLAVVLRPHTERDGCRLDRFDAYLDGELICTSRSGWHQPARKLLELGHSPDTLLHVQYDGRAFDPTIRPQTIGELAKWTIEESVSRWVEAAEVAAVWCLAIGGWRRKDGRRCIGWCDGVTRPPDADPSAGPKKRVSQLERVDDEV
jgi:hypothetical protein